MIISSTQNPKIKHFKQLQNKGYRQQTNLFLVQGLNPCLSLLNSGYQIQELLMTQEAYREHQETFASVQATDMITHDLAKLISTTVTPHSIVATFSMKQSNLQINENTIILDSIQDPGNVGTIIRTAAAMNIENVILINCADIYSPKVIQATAGCFGSINFIQTDWATTQTITKDYKKAAFVVHDGAHPSSIQLDQTILVFGNEGQGLSSDQIKECDYTVTIPMPGKTESLNAAIAASIAIYLKSEKNITYKG